MSSEDAPGPSSSEGLESDLTSRIMNNLRTSIAAEVKLAVEASKRQLQWHSRLARRTYTSVQTAKCEGREFEPPMEQIL